VLSTGLVAGEDVWVGEGGELVALSLSTVPEAGGVGELPGLPQDGVPLGQLCTSSGYEVTR
jgi:hypothetical protein